MLPGISGNLLPLQYIATHLRTAGGAPTHERFAKLWRHIAATCGPATGIRTIADVAAMPLVAELGYRAHAADFTRRPARCQLHARQPIDAITHTPRRPVALLISPWSHRSPTMWRAAVDYAREIGADWCLVIAVPALQIIDTRAHWSRQFLEFTLDEAARSPGTFDRLVALAHADALTSDGPASLHRTVAHGREFQDRVRRDLQHGVVESLGTLTGVQVERSEALAIVYRILFLLFVEARDLIAWRHPLYRPAYSIGTLCEMARRSPRAPGCWDGLAAVSRLLRAGCRTPRLDVPPFNGRLFARAAAASLERRRPHRTRRAADEDAAMGATLVALSTRRTPSGRETIAYPDLGVEQLGAVYERVLGLPDRKQSGSFYTPRALTELVVRHTLTPLTSGRTADRILQLKILDPAMGSGAFLVAACRHLADAYERALIDERRILDHEIDADRRADFRRLVAQRCLYGVDRNPTAVELARLSLWLATLSRGKPLSFLDHRLRAGDALVGAEPSDLQRVATTRRPAEAALPLFDLDDRLEPAARSAATALINLAGEPDDSIDIVRRKEAAWARLSGVQSGVRQWRLASDLWCARFFAGRAAPSPLELRAAIDALVRNDGTLPAGPLMRWLQHAARLREAHRFFHWPLEFADAYFDADGRPLANPGFDAIVGNPPWEMLRADHDTSENPAHLVRFIRDSGVYTDAGRGHINLYQPFLERALNLTRRGGRVGLVLPWGLASDDGAAGLRTRLLDRCDTSAIVGFDNKSGIFPVHRGVRFLTLNTSPGGVTRELRLSAGITDLTRVDEETGTRIPASLLARVGGTLRRIPDARRPGDIAMLDRLTSRFPSIGSTESYAATFGRELNITEDRGRFGDRGLPVIEGKHIQPFVTDAGSARFHITPARAAAALPAGEFTRARLAYRDISAVGNRHALIAAIIPAGIVTTHTLFCLKTALPIEQQYFLCACLNSDPINAYVRLLMGGHLTTSLIGGLPIPPWRASSRQHEIATLARALSHAPALTPADARSDRRSRLRDLLAAEFDFPGTISRSVY